MPKLNEKVLLYKLQTKRDPEAFARLYDLYAKRIYRFIFFKVAGHEEAEDITSEVFLKAWHYTKEQKKIESFSGLLYKLARNAIIDLYRAKNRQVGAIAIGEMELGDQGAWTKQLGVKMEAERIVGGLKQLKQEYREAVTLRYVDGLEIAEIAEILGKGKIAVRVTLHRGIKKLKELLEE
ncbi:RNA polymerase sigma factor [Patescibacteria group bacterium]|nr:MAG: RNA polymerase sigma factor [Patescibacteria group bacterium]